jgi:GNAT superfamily N-acetyltransferase
MRIQPAAGEDLSVLRAIERAAGERFREYGLDDVADDEPTSTEMLQEYATDGRAWVAVADSGDVIGYVLVDLIDDAAHIAQVSVDPDHQGQGAGRALIEQVASWAGGRGLPALTLATFDHIPWNRPLYEHLGFRVVPDDQLRPGLTAVRSAEMAHGLDPQLRVVMRRDLDAGP